MIFPLLFKIEYVPYDAITMERVLVPHRDSDIEEPVYIMARQWSVHIG